ncbi:MAG: PH domain-containing protein [Elusimicrobiales bacterium]|nr:PH domain-containing protein [Elusimicrobiales bacterium]
MSETGRYFKASMDSRLKSLTWIFSAVAAGASLTAALPMMAMKGDCQECCSAAAVNFGGWAILTLAAALLWSCWALAPRGFIAEPGLVTVDRPLMPVRIALRPGTIVEAAGAGLFDGSLRTMGNGGLFGYYGNFWKKGVGKYLLYATRSDRLVLVDNGKKYFLTPDEPELFIEEVRRCVPGA